MTLYVGEGPRGSNGARSTLWGTSVTSSATHSQIGPLWCWFPSGWACAHSRPLWVFPTTSPVRLGVSPAAASTLTGVFSQRFEALFPCAGALGCAVCFAPPLFLLVYLHGNVGLLGPLAPALPRVLSAWLSHLCPSYWSGWMFLLYLLGCWTSIQFNFLSVLVVFVFKLLSFFGCVRRHSVSTYASVLAGILKSVVII